MTVSAGISSWPACGDEVDAESLMQRADTALLRAKLRGGNQTYIDERVLENDERLVVVADHDHGLLELADDLLSMDDFRVMRVNAGAAVLEALRFRRPDLLILDLELAGDSDEPPLIERVRAIYPAESFPIIGLSSDPGTDPQELVRLGVDRFITKPFSLSLLRNAARELIETRP